MPNQVDPLSLPILAICTGDPAGVGPEISVTACASDEVLSVCRPLLIGNGAVLERARELCGSTVQLQAIADPSEITDATGTLHYYDIALRNPDELENGVESPTGGAAAYDAVAKAIEWALAGKVAGTVTAPLNKAALHAAGHHYAGHTEIYATLTGCRKYTMMLAEGNFRVSHVSTHVSLKEAINRVTKERVKAVIELSYEALVRMGIAKPRIAVAGLNPHAGEGGLFGAEDCQEILPAIEACRAAGIDADGPHPADTIFPKMAGGRYDLVVCMYHDQGHIPTKLKGFQMDPETGRMAALAGVNITLGLPIIRTSVDHGTAFDIAWQGIANPQSMIEATVIGGKLAAKREKA